eukprot:318406_1
MAQELKEGVTKTHISSSTTPGQSFNDDLDLHWVIEEMKERVDEGIIDWKIIQKQLFPSLNNNPNDTQIDKDHRIALTILQHEIKHHFRNYMKDKLKKSVPDPD